MQTHIIHAPLNFFLDIYSSKHRMYRERERSYYVCIYIFVPIPYTSSIPNARDVAGFSLYTLPHPFLVSSNMQRWSDLSVTAPKDYKVTLFGAQRICHAMPVGRGKTRSFWEQKAGNGDLNTHYLGGC